MLFFQTILGSFLNYWGLLPRRLLILIRFPFTISKRRRKRQLHAKRKLPKILSLSYGIVILISNFLDLLGVAEWMDVLFMLFKPKSRKLNKLEELRLKEVFSETLKTKYIRIDEKSWIANKGAKLAGYPNLGMGLVLFRSINFNRPIDCQNKKSDTAWLIHELTHVHQMQHIGIAYIFESLIAQHYLGYGLPKLDGSNPPKLNELNIEQQAEISKLYYLQIAEKVKVNLTLSGLIIEVQQGKFN